MEKHNTNISICIQPQGPESKISYGIDSEKINTITISETMMLTASLDLLDNRHIFSVELLNGSAIEIKSVTIEGMTLDRFKWSSRYYPVYPEPWASEQTEPLPDYQVSATYLGWPGRWELHFDTPIFTWIHKLENLGWIYGIEDHKLKKLT
jgi:hypothetical protein